MMCPLDSAAASPARRDGDKEYKLLKHAADHPPNLQGTGDPKIPNERLLQENKGNKSNVWGKTGCRLFNAQGIAGDQDQRELASKKLKRAIAICVIFMVLETVGGKFAGSLAVLADAAHILSDVAGFAISLLALRVSGWMATPHQTFGYLRLEVLGALVSVQVIWIMTGFIVYEAVHRLYSGIHIVDGRLMFSIALAGLFLNLFLIFILGHVHDHGDGGHWHGQSHTLLNHSHHNHHHDRTQDLENGQSHAHDHGCCSGSQNHGHEEKKRKHHKELHRIQDHHSLDCESNQSGKGPRDLHMDNLRCAGGELTVTPGSLQQQTHVGYYNLDVDLSSERKIGYSPQALDARFNLTDEETVQIKYFNDADGKLAAAEMSSLIKAGPDQLFEDGIQGQDHKHSSQGILNINLRGAYLHALGDLIQNIGVLITGLVIWIKPEWQFIDVVCSLVFSILVIVTTGKMLKDIMWIFMEGAPKDVDVELLGSGLLDIAGVSAVLDLHVWALTPGTNLVSCHLEINPGAVAKEVLHGASEYCYNFNQIKHVTIQIEDAI